MNGLDEDDAPARRLRVPPHLHLGAPAADQRARPAACWPPSWPGSGGPELPLEVSAIDSFPSATDAPQRSLTVVARQEVSAVADPRRRGDALRRLRTVPVREPLPAHRRRELAVGGLGSVHAGPRHPRRRPARRRGPARPRTGGRPGPRPGLTAPASTGPTCSSGPVAIRRRPGVPADIPGLEFAGVVEAVGPDVASPCPGDRVMGIVAGGGQAEYLVTAASHCARVPGLARPGRGRAGSPRPSSPPTTPWSSRASS